MKYGLLLMVVILLAACSKDAGEKDSALPVITLTDPVNGAVFTAGQSIRIRGTISDNNYIAEVHIHVSNLNTGALLMDVHLYPNGATGAFDQSLAATPGINYKIQVIAKDRAVNESRTTVEVSCN